MNWFKETLTTLSNSLHDSTNTQDKGRARRWSVTLSISLSNDRQSHGSLTF